jgi:ArsR family transcriptional regulator
MNTSTVVEPTDIEVSRATEIFAALGEPARLRILAVLADAGRCVCDIHAAVPMAANLLSYHLRVLREAGLIESTRRGRFVDYRLSPTAARLLTGALGCTGFGATVDQPPGSADAYEVPSP